MLGVTNRINGEIDIQFRPVEMIVRWQFDMQYLAYGRIAKPWEFSERQEQLLFPQENPETVPRYMRDFKLRNVCAKRRGCHFRAPVPVVELH